MDMTLTKKSTQALQCGSLDLPAVTFTDIEKTILELAEPSSENPKMADYSEKSLTALATKIAARANARYGNNPQEVEATINFLKIDLKRFKNLRVLEIFNIVDRGINGEFDKEDVRHFSSSRFVKWINTYLETLKQPASSKKAQYDHQQLIPLTPSEQEEKVILESGFGWFVNKLESGEMPKYFQGLDSVFDRCEKLRVFDPLTKDERMIIGKGCQTYTGFEGEKLKVFSQKVAYLYVLHQAAMKSYTLIELVRHVADNDKSMTGYYADLAQRRLEEYAEYRKEQEAIIEPQKEELQQVEI